MTGEDREAGARGGPSPTVPARPAIRVPLCLLLGATLLILVADLDLRVARSCYSAEGGWVLAHRAVVEAVVSWGTWPAFSVAAAALCALVLGGSVPPRLGIRRRSAVFLLLGLLLGPGAVVNGVLKEHYGRPRPVQLIEFGGDKEFLPVFVPGPRGNGWSFPSGHASMGFFLMSPYFLVLERRRRLARGCLVLGIGCGLVVGTARMLQGAHFLSDVLWSGGVVYLVGYGLYYALLRRPPTMPA